MFLIFCKEGSLLHGLVVLTALRISCAFLSLLDNINIFVLFFNQLVYVDAAVQLRHDFAIGSQEMEAN
jgi:hypothetical protein